jgi:hypothetical protein
MGLDVYVGTLTRYLIGDWELAAAAAARELGVPFEVIRENEAEDAVTDPDEVRAAVLEWRAALGEALGLELDWPEDDGVPYLTDKPDWTGHVALLLVAAHEEHPDLPLPEALPDEPLQHPLYRAVTEQPKRGLLGRRTEPAEPPRYAALYTPEVWLPVETEAVWQAPFVTGDMTVMTSTHTLLTDLQDLARRLGASTDDLEVWRRGDELGDRPRETIPLARFALALWLELAQWAVEHRLPAKLDY